MYVDFSEGFFRLIDLLGLILRRRVQHALITKMDGLEQTSWNKAEVDCVTCDYKTSD